MTKVSRLPLRPDIWERTFTLFTETLADIRNRDEVANFVCDFFSPTEKVMFAKRLATALLLAKGHDYNSVRQILRISPPTIAKMSFKVNYEGKGLNPVLNKIMKKQALMALWQEIVDTFDMPVKGQTLSSWSK